MPYCRKQAGIAIPRTTSLVPKSIHASLVSIAWRWNPIPITSVRVLYRASWSESRQKAQRSSSMSQHSKMAAPSLAAKLSMTWRHLKLRAMPSSPIAMMPVWMMSRIRYIPGIYLEEIRDKKVVSCHFSCKVYVIKIYTSSPNPKFTTSSMILPSIIYNKVLNFRKCRNYRS